jgi:hypothetical protein
MRRRQNQLDGRYHQDDGKQPSQVKTGQALCPQIRACESADRSSHDQGQQRIDFDTLAHRPAHQSSCGVDDNETGGCGSRLLRSSPVHQDHQRAEEDSPSHPNDPRYRPQRRSHEKREPHVQFRPLAGILSLGQDKPQAGRGDNKDKGEHDLISTIRNLHESTDESSRHGCGDERPFQLP